MPDEVVKRCVVNVRPNAASDPLDNGSRVQTSAEPFKRDDRVLRHGGYSHDMIDSVSGVSISAGTT